MGSQAHLAFGNIPKTSKKHNLCMVSRAWPRLKLLSSIISVAMSLQSKNLRELEIGFWCFLLLLGINALYPSILILLPEWRLIRLAAASIDAFLDLGYTLTYIAIVLSALPALSSQSAVFGNFGDEDLLISNELTPTFAFPSDALGFAAVYVSLAHVLAVCRALERAREGGVAHSDQLGKKARGKRGVKTKRRTFLIAGFYSSLLFLVICWNLYGASYPWQRPHDFRCFPCRCEPLANQSLRLERCDVPDILRYKQLSLSNSTIAEIAPGSLPKNLKVLALSGNPLKNLTGGLFTQMAHLQVWASVAIRSSEGFGYWQKRWIFFATSLDMFCIFMFRTIFAQKFHVQVFVSQILHHVVHKYVFFFRESTQLNLKLEIFTF